MQHRSTAGALSTAIYWFKALDWGYATTNSALPRTLFDQRCSTCAKFMADFDDTAAAKQYFSGGRIRVLGAAMTHDSRYASDFAVDVKISTSRLLTRNARAQIVHVDPAINDLTFRVWLAWKRTQFVVVAFKEVRYK